MIKIPFLCHTFTFSPIQIFKKQPLSLVICRRCGEPLVGQANEKPQDFVGFCGVIMVT